MIKVLTHKVIKEYCHCELMLSNITACLWENSKCSVHNFTSIIRNKTKLQVEVDFVFTMYLYTV